MDKNLDLTIRLKANKDGSLQVIKATAKEIEDVGVKAKKTSEQVGHVTKKTDLLSKSVKRLHGYVGGFALGLIGKAALGQVIDAADNMQQLEARIKNATKASGDFQDVWDELQSLSLGSGSGLSETVSLFQSLARTAPELNATNTQMLQLTETVQQLGAISGATQEQQKNSMLQFSQAMAGGVLQAEEFNSILDNTPELAARIATGMDKTVGQLRQAVIKGTVLSKDVFDALLKQSKDINTEFEAMPLSMGRVISSLGLAFDDFIAEANAAVGGVNSITLSLQSMAEWLYSLDGAVAGSALIRLTKIAGVGGSLALGLFAINTALPVTAAGMATLTTATKGLIAVYASWELGSFINEQFLEVRVANHEMIGVLKKGWATAVLSAEVAWEAIKAGFVGAFNVIKAKMANQLAGASLAAGAVGAGELADKLMLAADNMRPLISASDDLKAKTAELREAYEAEIQGIDNVTAAFVDHEITLDKQATALTKTKKTLSDYKIELGGVAGSTDKASKAVTAFFAPLIEKNLLLTQGARALFEYKAALALSSEEEVNAALALYDTNKALEDAADKADKIRKKAAADQLALKKRTIAEDEALERQADQRLLDDQRELAHEFEHIFRDITADGESFAKNMGDMWDGMLNRMLDSVYQFSINKLVSGLTSGNYGDSLLGLAAGAVAVGASYLMNNDNSPSRAPDSLTTTSGDDRALGYQKQIAADIQSRDYFYAEQLTHFKELNYLMGVQTQVIKNAAMPYYDQIQNFLQGSANSLSSSLADLLPDSISGVFGNIGSYISTVMDASGLGGMVDSFTGAFDGVTSYLTDTVNGLLNIGVNTSEFGPVDPSAGSTSGTVDNLGAVTGVLTAAYSIYGLVSGWSALSTSERVVGTLGSISSVISAGASVVTSIASAAGTALSATASTVLAAIPVVGWVIAGVMNLYSAVDKALDGDRTGSIDQIITGGLGGMIEGWLGMEQGSGIEFGSFGLIKNRTPNTWIETAALQGGINETPVGFTKTSSSDPYSSTTGNKDARVGVNTAFGRANFSTHELSMSDDEVRRIFVPALSLIKEVDDNVAHAINSIEGAAGGVGETMKFYTEYLDAGNLIHARQEFEDTDAAGLISYRYNQIADVLDQSGTKVGVAFNAWFDTFSLAFGDEYAANIFNLIGDNLQSFVDIPVALSELINGKIKAPNVGGTAEDAVGEIVSVLGAYEKLSTTLAVLGADIPNDEVAGFLIHLNSIGFAVEAGAESLAIYANVLYLAGEDIALGMRDVIALSDTMTSADFSHFVSTLGQLTHLSQALNLATSLHDLTAVSHIIADIAKSTLDNADALAEADKYGGTDAKAQLEAMGIATDDAILNVVNDIMFLNNTLTFFDSSVAQMGFRLDATLVNFSSGLIQLMGGIEEASKTFDNLAKGFLSEDKYKEYSLKNLQSSSDSLQSSLGVSGINFDNFLDEMSKAITIDSLPQTVKNWTDLGNILLSINSLTSTTADSLKTLMADVNESLRVSGLSDFQRSMDGVNLKFTDLTRNAIDLGASSEDLASISALRVIEEGKLIDAQKKSLASFQRFVNQTVAILNLGFNADAQEISDQYGGINEIQAKWSFFIDHFYTDLEVGGVKATKAAEAANVAIASLNIPGLTKDNFKDMFVGLLQMKQLTAEQQLIWLDVAEAIGLSNDAAKNLTESLTDQIGNVVKQNQVRYEKEIDYLTSINEYVDGLLVDKNLSPLTNKERFSEAEAQFNLQLGLARSGDTDALQNITKFADTYLNEARGLYSSSDQYTDIFKGVTDSLKGIPAPELPASDGQLISDAIVDQTLKLILDSNAGTDAIIAAIEANFTPEQIQDLGLYEKVFQAKLDAYGFGHVNVDNFRDSVDAFSKRLHISTDEKTSVDDLIKLFNHFFAGSTPVTTQIISDNDIAGFASTHSTAEVLEAAKIFGISTDRLAAILGTDFAQFAQGLIPVVTDQSIVDFVNSHSDDAMAIYKAAVQYDISLERLAKLTPYTTEQINEWIKANGLDPLRRDVTNLPLPTVTDQNISDFVNANQSDYKTIYEEAVKYGISIERLAAATDFTVGQIQQWISDNNLPQLSSQHFVSDQQIQDFVAANAGDAKAIYEAAIANNISIERLAGLTFLTLNEIRSWISGGNFTPLRSEQVAVSDQDILDFLAKNSDPTAIYDAAKQNGVSAERLASLSELSVEDINQWIEDNNKQGLNAQPQQTSLQPQNTGISDQQIVDFVNANPDPYDIYKAAKEFGVSAERLASLTDLTLSEITQWVSDNNLATLSNRSSRSANKSFDTRDIGKQVSAEVKGQSLVSDQQIIDFVNANPDPDLIYQAAINHAVSAERLASLTDLTVGQINQWVAANDLAPLVAQSAQVMAGMTKRAIKEFTDSVASPRAIYDAVIVNNENIKHLSGYVATTVNAVDKLAQYTSKESAYVQGNDGFSAGDDPVMAKYLDDRRNGLMGGIRPVYNQALGGQPVSIVEPHIDQTAITDQQIKDFVESHSGNLKQIYDAAIKFNVSSQRLADNSPWSQAEILDWTQAAGLPAFEKGGAYQGGLALVGEKGPELINFDSPGQVYTAPQTSQILNKHDNSDVVAELKALRQAVADLKKQNMNNAEAIVESTYEANQESAKAIVKSQVKTAKDHKWRDNKTAVS